MTEFEKRWKELKEKELIEQDLKEFREFKEFRRLKEEEERRQEFMEKWRAEHITKKQSPEPENPPSEPVKAKNPKRRLTIVLLIVVIICIIGCAVSAFKAVQYWQENTSLSKKLQATTERKDKYLYQRDLCIDNLEVYYEDFAYITETGEKYHKWGCPHIENSSLYVNYITELKRQGYRKCHTCYNNDFKVWE